ncbi:hypothetical protein [Streptomyces sp. AC558_RSS880]|uniref:hypothetical protein n=1 Tax=Streptomyces sp. AC558_RSS880 TaxID=2823687 RepID=UPI001C24857C|nr:hypothetical protein [Streptomyces sp. AC558_RSS880]
MLQLEHGRTTKITKRHEALPRKVHYMRSHRYRDVYTTAFETVRVKVRSELVERFPEPLRREALRQTGLHLAGSGSLDAFTARLVEQSEVTQDFGTGAVSHQHREHVQ